MSVVTEEVLRTIAAMLDHPSVYMGGSSQRNMRLAGQILAVVAPMIAKAERERCARVAEKEVWCPCGGPPCQTPPGHGCGVQPANGEEIAAAIRSLGDAT